jgi:hypothetical protein
MSQELAGELFAKMILGERDPGDDIVTVTVRNVAPEAEPESAPEPDWDDIAGEAQGTCKSEIEIAEMFNLSDRQADRIHEELLDRDVQLCSNCGWWWETSEMFDGEMCNDCEEGY